MSMISKVKNHPYRSQIDQDIIKGRSNTYIAEHYSIGQYTLSREAVRRYREELLLTGISHFSDQTIDNMIHDLNFSLFSIDDLMKAAIDALTDEKGKMYFAPRAEDIKVSYLTHDDPKHPDKKKFANLQEMIDLVRHGTQIDDLKIHILNTKHPTEIMFKCADLQIRYLWVLYKGQQYKWTHPEIETERAQRSESNSQDTLNHIVALIKEALEDYPEALEAVERRFIKEVEPQLREVGYPVDEPF